MQVMKHLMLRVSVAEELGMTNVSHESLADISGTELPTGIEYDIGKLHHARVK